MPGIARLSSVTTPADDYDLVDLATVKLELRKTDKADDEILSKYITWSSAGIASETDRVFVVETIQDRFLLDRVLSTPVVNRGASILQLSRWPVVSVTSVTENGTLLVADTDFAVDRDNGKLLRLSSDGNVKSWHSWPVIVVYQGGYSELPGDITDAAVRMVKNRWHLRGRDQYLKSENIPGVRDATWWIATGNEAGNLPPDVASILDGYRVPVIG